MKEVLGREGLVALKGVMGAAMESERVKVRAVFVAAADTNRVRRR